jgi:2-alkyl-3-oxoalkanoate reductase
MRIFVAGAAGAVGRRLVPLLVAAGHEVVGTTHVPANTGPIRAMGAEPVVMDALDATAVKSAMEQAAPQVVVHELTALAGPTDFRRFDQSFALTNRLRTEGTGHLLAAARTLGVRRFVVQSFTGWTNERSGGVLKTEDDPIDPHPSPETVQTLGAIRSLESTVDRARDVGGVALRYGILYGPGTAIAPGGEVFTLIRRRRLPIVGSGAGIWSFLHVDDAAQATLLAIGTGHIGVYNIVDDDPAPVSAWLPYLAEVIEAPKPLRVPALAAQPLLGRHGVAVMTAIRGSSNAKAHRDLGWQLRYPSWRQGFREGLR